MRAPIEHRYTLNGEAYCLQEALYIDEERRIKQFYALGLTLTPSMLEAAQLATQMLPEAVWQTYSRILETLDSQDTYARAVTQVCLKEAPALWWRQSTPSGAVNGTPTRVITFEAVPTALWRAHSKEVATFLGLIFRAQEAESGEPPRRSPPDTGLVEVPETVPAVFRGRAE